MNANDMEMIMRMLCQQYNVVEGNYDINEND